MCGVCPLAPGAGHLAHQSRPARLPPPVTPSPTSRGSELRTLVPAAGWPPDSLPCLLLEAVFKIQVPPLPTYVAFGQVPSPSDPCLRIVRMRSVDVLTSQGVCEG